MPEHTDLPKEYPHRIPLEVIGNVPPETKMLFDDIVREVFMRMWYFDNPPRHILVTEGPIPTDPSCPGKVDYSNDKKPGPSDSWISVSMELSHRMLRQLGHLSVPKNVAAAFILAHEARDFVSTMRDKGYRSYRFDDLDYQIEAAIEHEEHPDERLSDRVASEIVKQRFGYEIDTRRDIHLLGLRLVRAVRNFMKKETTLV